MVVIKIITFTYLVDNKVKRGCVCTRYKTKPTWEEQMKHYLEYCYNAMSVPLIQYMWGDLETM